MSTRKAQDLYKQSSRVILKEVMENANKMEKCEKNKSINFSQIIIEFGVWYCMGYELYELGYDIVWDMNCMNAQS